MEEEIELERELDTEDYSTESDENDFEDLSYEHLKDLEEAQVGMLWSF